MVVFMSVHKQSIFKTRVCETNAGLVDVLHAADAWRQGKLTSSEYDETTWSARKYLLFAMQRISVAAHLAMAQEVAEALGLSVAADPRAC